ncbi:MAG: hypothetical protein ACKO5K_00470 [Armatimonadota bacterium]
MMLDGPLFHGAIGRLEESTRNLRAWGLVMQLSLLIESPVIMLLATSIAWNRDRQAYRVLRAFTVALCVACTVVAAGIAFTRIFDTIGVGWLGYPAESVDAARLPMQVMVAWSAAIGWRRFQQGLLVRRGSAQLVTLGTVARLGSMALACCLLVPAGRLPGALVAAIAMMIGVVVEAIASTTFARRCVRELPSDANVDPITLRTLLEFHAPLAATALLGLAAQPIVAAALSTLPDKERTLAAWPVVFSLLLVIRGWGLALQETTVGQLRTHQSDRRTVLHFAWRVAALSSLATLMLSLPMVLGPIAAVLSLPRELTELVRSGLLWGALLPFATAMASWTRGVLTAEGDTRAVYRATICALAAQSIWLFAAVRWHWNPIPSAALSLLAADATVLGITLLALRRRI